MYTRTMNENGITTYQALTLIEQLMQAHANALHEAYNMDNTLNQRHEKIGEARELARIANTIADMIE